jgi:hypothetical protein
MTAVAEPLNSDHRTARREERLLRLLERASASSRFNFGERWLFGVGGACVVAGFVVVVIGWAGASRTVLVSGQIPYLLSGGLIGLGLIFVGAFLYFGHWMAVMVRENRERGVEDRDDLASVRQGLEDLNRTLTAVASALTGTAATAPAGTAAGIPTGTPATASSPARAAEAWDMSARLPLRPAGDETAPVLLATATGTMAHRPGCRALAGKPNLRSVSVADGLKPCGMCRPLDQSGLQ